MELRIFTEPQQGADYDTLLAGPTDAWITLAGLARETSRIKLGTLMSAGTFRLPGVLAIQVAQVDVMSGGRVEFGLGAGWFEAEHTAYGIPFPKEKIGRLAEQLAVITGLWETPVGKTFDFDGEFYQLKDSPALPKPAQAKVPVLIGGMGAKRTPALAARYADEFNVPFASIEDSGLQIGRVRDAVREAGRPADSMVYSNALVVCVGRDDAEVARRAAAIGREVAELKENGLAGSPAEVVEKIGRYAEQGATRFYLQTLDLSDLDHLELIAAQVAPQLG
jgi:F420-dependent oxidoreductase-like protein